MINFHLPPIAVKCGGERAASLLDSVVEDSYLKSAFLMELTAAHYIQLSSRTEQVLN